MFRIPALSRSRQMRAAKPRRFSVRGTCEMLEERALLTTTAVTLNEVWATPFGLSNANRYVEISGPAGQTIGNVEFVQFDGYGNGSPKGAASYVKDLSGLTLGSNGLLLLEPSSGGVVAADPATVTVKDANFALAGGTEFYALVNYTGGSQVLQGDQLDPSNTGTIDLTAYGSNTVIDGVEFVYNSTPNTTDRAYNVKETVGGTTSTYSNTNFYLPVGTITPNAATREATGTYLTSGYTPGGAFSAGYTASGTQQYQANTPTTTVFHAASASGAFAPTNGYALTPGGANNVAVLSLSASSYGVTEGNTLTVTVNRTNGTASKSGSGNELIQYQTADITAYDGTNYTGTSGGLTFTSAGANTQTFTITTLNTSQTSDLQFFVLLKHPNNTFLALPSYAIVTETA